MSKQWFRPEITKYDGSLIHNRFAYSIYRKDVVRSGDIVAFIGPMEVTDNLIDLEDSLEKDFIYSEKAINFCWEIPHVELFGGIAFQRLFNTAIANILHSIIKAPIEMKGDDLIVHKSFEQGGIVQQKGKASVSITAEKNGAVVGHTGINIVAGKRAPAFAYSTNLTDEQAMEFINRVCTTFYEMTDDIFVATTKIVI